MLKTKNLLFVIFMLCALFSLGFSAQKQGKFIGGKDTTMPSWFLSSFLDLNEDIEELSSQNKRLILLFHQPNCPYCHKFITKNLEDKKIKAKILKNFAVIDINMFGDREVTDIDGNTYSEKEFAIKYKVQFTPTVIFFDEKANQVLRLNGYQNIQKLNLALDYVKDKEQGSYKEYMVQKLKQQSSGGLISEPDLFIATKDLRQKGTPKEYALFFETANCSDCETLHKKLLKDKISRELLSKMKLYQLDLDSNNSLITPDKMILKIKDWANSLNVTTSPTIIFFDTKGKEIIRIESMVKTFHFQTVIDYVVSGAYKSEKEFQRYLTKRANAIRAKGIDVNIWD